MQSILTGSFRQAAVLSTLLKMETEALLSSVGILARPSVHTLIASFQRFVIAEQNRFLTAYVRLGLDRYFYHR